MARKMLLLHTEKTLFSFLVILVLLPGISSLTLQIEPKAEECFFQYAERDQEVEALYSVTRGGLLDIDVRIYDPQGNTLYQGLHFDTKMKGRQHFVAGESGVYKFCFNNEMSRFTAKVISFRVNVGQDKSKPEVAKPEDLSPMENSVVKIERVLQTVIAEQRRMRIREQVHRDTSESTNSRVSWWSVFETGLIIFMGAAQVWYLRRWFEVKQGRV